MATDNLILIRLNIQAGVLLGNTFYRRQQRRQIFDIRGIGADRIEQRLTLIAIALIVHIEHVFELGIVLEHTIVEMCGQLRPGSGQQGNSRFYGGDGLAIQHGSAPWSIIIGIM
ncbi:hypothetical protein D3C80_1328500 [compost metagenome]